MSHSDREIPAAILLFGVAGVGKTYLAAILAERLGVHHYELDNDLTDEMRAAISAGREFTDPIRDRFFVVAGARMQQVLAQHPRTIFTQGVYKERHREYLRRLIPGLECIWVDAPPELIASRLMLRGRDISSEYARLIHRNFESPTQSRILINDTTEPEQLVARFRALFST
jgi:gluconokinase